MCGACVVIFFSGFWFLCFCKHRNWKTVKYELIQWTIYSSSNLRAQSPFFFTPEFPVQPVITCRSSPPPLFALPGRKQSSSDVLYGPSRLGRNQDVLLGAGMIVSALAGRFVSLQVISWMNNDRYTFPAIFHFCRRGSEKHGTLWPWGHRCKQVGRHPKLVETKAHLASHKTSQ